VRSGTFPHPFDALGVDSLKMRDVQPIGPIFDRGVR
jgi:hypothetical protein